MNEILERDLYLKYPKIFRMETSGSDQDNFCSLDVSDGWYDLISELCSCIQHHIDWKNCEGKYESHKKHRTSEELEKSRVPQVVATQVKEKFAGLRFYYTGGDDEISGMITLAESFSARICETCGSPGRKSGPGWIRTLCKKHAEEEGRKHGDAEEDTENG
jgi:hypothetical protein